MKVLSRYYESILVGAAAAVMAEDGFSPGAVVSIGCGYAKEATLFTKFYPSARYVGVDAISGFGLTCPGEFVNALVCRTNRTTLARRRFWVRRGRTQASTMVPYPGNRYRRLRDGRRITLDELWAEKKLTGVPTLLWLDAEGSEGDIVLSGPQAKLDCRYVLTEVTVGSDLRATPRQMRWLMQKQGYQLIYAVPGNKIETQIFKRVDR